MLLGNSGVGKSSLAQAGVLAALKRQAWPEGAGAGDAGRTAFKDSRRWCFLTLKPGTEPIKALVEAIPRYWQIDRTEPERVKRCSRLDRKSARRQGHAARPARRHRRRATTNSISPSPPAFFLYIDQGEELYVRAEERQRRRFSEILAQALGDPRLRAMMSLRADFFGESAER